MGVNAKLNTKLCVKLLAFLEKVDPPNSPTQIFFVFVMELVEHADFIIFDKLKLELLKSI